jgi:hypothetical protein
LDSIASDYSSSINEAVDMCEYDAMEKLQELKLAYGADIVEVGLNEDSCIFDFDTPRYESLSQLVTAVTAMDQELTSTGEI